MVHPPPEAYARRRWYRERGWWPGERLEDRYQRISACRQEELAVADSRGRRLSHRQLATMAEEFGEVLRRGGAGPGDRVLLQLPNWV